MKAAWVAKHPGYYAAEWVKNKTKLAAKSAAYHVAHREELLKLKKKYRAKHSAEIKKYEAEYRVANKARLQKWRVHHHLKHKYGITKVERDAMNAQQRGVCAICGKAPSGRGTQGVLQVDHDHSTGAIRALLCCRCNKAIGLFHDDSDIAQRAADYLKKFDSIKKYRLAGVCP